MESIEDTDENAVNVTEIIITVDGMEWMEESEDDEKASVYYENIENVLDEQTSIEEVNFESANLSSTALPKTKKHKSKYKEEEEEDPFCTVDKFWSEHTCSEHCTSKFTKDEVVQLRSACEALDEYVDGTNRLDLVILAMIRALVRTKSVRNRAYKAREERKLNEVSGVEEVLNSQKERKKYTCNFMVEGQSVCRTFFLFVHNIGVKRWGRLMKVYKSEGLVEKYHGLCNRKPANTTPLENVQFVVQFLRKYSKEHGTNAPIRLSQQHSDVRLLPVGESKSSVYDKYIEACSLEEDPTKAVSKISFNRIWRQCCPNLLTQKPRAASEKEKQCNGIGQSVIANSNDSINSTDETIKCVIEEFAGRGRTMK